MRKVCAQEMIMPPEKSIPSGCVLGSLALAASSLFFCCILALDAPGELLLLIAPAILLLLFCFLMAKLLGGTKKRQIKGGMAAPAPRSEDLIAQVEREYRARLRAIEGLDLAQDEKDDLKRRAERDHLRRVEGYLG